MAAARPAWEQALVTAQGVPRYAHWGFGDVVDPRQEFQGVQGMTRFMTFFRDHPQSDAAVINFAQYARVLDAEYHSEFFYWSIVRPGRHAGGVYGRFPLNIKVRIDAYERQNHPLQSAEA